MTYRKISSLIEQHNLKTRTTDPGNPQASLTKEKDRLTSYLHLSVSSKSSPPAFLPYPKLSSRPSAAYSLLPYPLLQWITKIFPSKMALSQIPTLGDTPWESTREAGRQTADLHLSLLSKYNCQISYPSLWQTTCWGFPFLFTPIPTESHRSSLSKLLSPLTTLSTPYISWHFLGTHRPFLPIAVQNLIFFVLFI